MTADRSDGDIADGREGYIAEGYVAAGPQSMLSSVTIRCTVTYVAYLVYHCVF